VFLLSFIGTWSREETKSDLISQPKEGVVTHYLGLKPLNTLGILGTCSSHVRVKSQARPLQGLKIRGNFKLSRRHTDWEFEFGLM
jgi:hypothetical protein